MTDSQDSPLPKPREFWILYVDNCSGDWDKYASIHLDEPNTTPNATADTYDKFKAVEISAVEQLRAENEKLKDEVKSVASMQKLTREWREESDKYAQELLASLKEAVEFIDTRSKCSTILRYGDVSELAHDDKICGKCVVLASLKARHKELV